MWRSPWCAHQCAPRTHLRDRRLTKSDFLRPDGAAWVPWTAGEWVAAPLFQMQAWGPTDQVPTYASVLKDTVAGIWQLRRAPSIMRPVAAIVRRTATGIP